MGSTFSTRGDADRRDDPETVFMVPGHLNLSLRQMDVILRAGQQPGVPFRLGASGAQRPQGNRVKVNYAENLISMQKNSLRVTECESNIENIYSSGKRGGNRRGGEGEQQSSYTVSFNYDSAVPAVVRIFIGATDKTVPLVIKAEGGSLILGPYRLEEGKNRHWSSRIENCYIEERHLTARSMADQRRDVSVGGTNRVVDPEPSNGGSKHSDVFDLMVCLSPIEMACRTALFAAHPRQKEGAWQMQKRGYGLHPLPPTSRYSESALSSLSGRSNPNSNVHKSGSKQSLGVKEKEGGGNDSLPVTSDGDAEGDKVLDRKARKKPTTPEVNSSKSGASSIVSVDYTHSQRNGINKNVITPSDVVLTPDYGRQAIVICEVSYLRLTPIKEIIKQIPSVQNVDALDCQYNVIDGDAEDERSDHNPEPDAPRPSSSKQFEVKCMMQRVQMTSGVFLTQDIYGMDRNRIEEEQPAVENDPNGDGTPSAPVTTPGGITLDSDAIECVICLTDNRIIAVYPCRHMCLCASCAEVLPSQGNKCPICRRGASMLLKINPKGGSKEAPV